MIECFLTRLLCLLCILSNNVYSFNLFKNNYRFSKVLSSEGVFMSINDKNNEDNNAVNNFWRSKINIVSDEVSLKNNMNELEREAARIALQEELEKEKQLEERRIPKPKSSSSSNDISDSTTTTSSTTTKRQQQQDDWDMSISYMLKDEGIGITGRWKEVAGNFVLYPKSLESQSPQGVIHFLGGAFVGAAPHLTYRYLLESLCEEGYIVVATPYRLQLDYLETCDEILSKFDLVGAELAKAFGGLPVIGVGHSCGALLHTLVTSLFPDAPRAANVLISFNNKPVKEAIPAFDELIVPLSEQLLGTSNGNSKNNSNNNNSDSDSTTDNDNNNNNNIGAEQLRELATSIRNIFDDILEGVGTSDVSPRVVKDEIVPTVKQCLEVLDQIPDLLASIADGSREFIPSPEDTREAARRMYRARRTLLIQFENDSIDESEEIETVLKEAYTIMRMKRPLVEMEVELKQLGGSHITPLTQNILFEPPMLEFDGQSIPDPLAPFRRELRGNFLQTIDEVKLEIVDWLAKQ